MVSRCWEEGSLVACCSRVSPRPGHNMNLGRPKPTPSKNHTLGPIKTSFKKLSVFMLLDLPAAINEAEGEILLVRV